MRRTRMRLLATALTAALALSACSSNDDSTTAESTAAAASAEGTATEAAADEKGTHTVIDADGNSVEVPNKPQRVIATDNTVFRTIHDWGVKLVAAPQGVIASTSPYKTDSSINNIGNHREPNMEVFVAEDPDLVLTGYRFGKYLDEIKQLVPNAAVVNTDIRSGFGGDDVPLDEKLRKQTVMLGEALDKQKEADKLVKDFNAAIERAQKAYNKDETVMGLLTSGGDINYAAPHVGRSVGPVFDIVGLTPALEVENASKEHTGDDISVEAIAQANPDWIIVLDRDAAVAADKPEYKSAADLIANSEALQSVPAVKNGNIIVLEPDFYQTEDIQAYTKLLNQMAEAMENASKNTGA
ncbi:siderophore ABC transporter substrate-binding protein [Corynebacterium aquilae]|uniref:siderophore ABC transporter substrate-binding protein n=1 Tax=Corynebacterium aquilae TaxID=203263 RepID=UPI00095283A2|nr:ABC transporter substrate-binding protein [Corynebacterium aquilae]